jgi:hypothetical protein
MKGALCPHGEERAGGEGMPYGLGSSRRCRRIGGGGLPVSGGTTSTDVVLIEPIGGVIPLSIATASGMKRGLFPSPRPSPRGRGGLLPSPAGGGGLLSSPTHGGLPGAGGGGLSRASIGSASLIGVGTFVSIVASFDSAQGR